MLSRSIEGGLGVVLGVLRDLQVSQRYGPVLVQNLRSIQLLARKKLIGDGLAVGVEASRMSSLRTRSKSWPFFTASPRRARMSTMRPEASEITGTVRAMSGNTVPVTDNCDGAWYSVDVTIGYCSGCSTAKKETSTPETTLAGGGASASAFTLSLLQPLVARDAAIAISIRPNAKYLLFIRILAPLFCVPLFFKDTLQLMRTELFRREFFLSLNVAAVILRRRAVKEL
jgi:hypothetical protein